MKGEHKSRNIHHVCIFPLCAHCAQFSIRSRICKERTLSFHCGYALFLVYFLRLCNYKSFHLLHPSQLYKQILGHMKVKCIYCKIYFIWHNNNTGKKLFLPSSLFWNMFFGQWIGMDRIRPDRIGLDLIWLAHALVMNNFFSPFGLYSFVDLSHFASANHMSFIYNT